MPIQNQDHRYSSDNGNLSTYPPNTYRQLWDRTASGLYRASLNGRFLEVNAAYADVLEYESARQLVGQVTCIAHEIYQSPTRWAELLTYLRQNDTIQGFESPVWTGRGSVRWVTECVHLVSDEQNGRYILEGVVQDITDRKHDERRREYDRLNRDRVRQPVQGSTFQGSQG